MNKTLVAAIGGVTFGVTLCASVVHLRVHSRQLHCQRMATRQVFVLHRPAPPPLPVQVPELVEREVSPCSPESPVAQLIPEQRLSVAQTEYVNARYDCAMKLARAETRSNPERAYRIIGAAACNTGNLAAVTEAFGHLHGAGRQYLIYVCQRQHIDYRHGRFFSE